jgi:hypothetical protein
VTEATAVRHQHTVVGTLVRNAEARMCLGGAWIVMMELRQATPTAPPIVAVHQHGQGEPARAAAHSEANRLRQGARARIYFTGLGLGHTRDEKPAIDLRGVDAVHNL